MKNKLVLKVVSKMESTLNWRAVKSSIHWHDSLVAVLFICNTDKNTLLHHSEKQLRRKQTRTPWFNSKFKRINSVFPIGTRHGDSRDIDSKKALVTAVVMGLCKIQASNQWQIKVLLIKLQILVEYATFSLHPCKFSLVLFEENATLEPQSSNRREMSEMIPFVT